MWEQQQELALEYLADIEKANERIAELEQEIDDYETTYKGSVVEAQAKRIAELEIPLCIGETTIRILAKEGAKVFEDGRGLVAADELFKQDPYARIAELEAALKPFAEAAICLDDDDEFGHIWEHKTAMLIHFEDLRNARKVLGEKE
jgi:hypothetical protein